MIVFQIRLDDRRCVYGKSGALQSIKDDIMQKKNLNYNTLTPNA